MLRLFLLHPNSTCLKISLNPFSPKAGDSPDVCLMAGGDTVFPYMAPLLWSNSYVHCLALLARVVVQRVPPTWIGSGVTSA